MRPCIDHVCFAVENFDVDRIEKALGEYGLEVLGQAFRSTGSLQTYQTARMPDHGGDPQGTKELYFTDPDGTVVQLQDVRYVGGCGSLGETRGTSVKHPFLPLLSRKHRALGGLVITDDSPRDNRADPLFYGKPRMKRKLSTYFAIALVLCIAAVTVTDVQGQSSEKTEGAEGNGLLSILDVAPPVYHSFRRMPKFYGDPNMDRATVDGPILGRQYLLGSLGGLRDRAAENGLIFDTGLTQVVQGTASGDGDGGRYFGSADLWLGVDTGRARLWSGGLIVAHLEGNWGEVVENTGALLPLNADTIMPAEPSSYALSELYIVQALPKGFSLIAGKINFGDNADKSPFANDERNHFIYEGLVNNPLYGVFLPYTSLGTALSYQINPHLDVWVAGLSNNTKATTVGFSDLSWDTMTYATGADWTPTFGGFPGFYSVLLGYTTKDTLAFDVDERYLIEEIVGAVPPATKSENYGVTVTASQYLWADRSAKRSDGQPIGVGPFLRFGIVPKDRNLLDQFYSFGFGGIGGPFGRHDDNWGIGWAGTHISGDFRSDVSLLGLDVDSFENVLEAFYNVALTPAVRTSFHVQYIDSANPKSDNSVVLATRLQLDF